MNAGASSRPERAAFPNNGRIEVIAEIVAPSFVNHSAPPGIPPDREGLKQVVMLFINAFPGGQITIEDTVADGDRMATRKDFQGTHTGVFMGISPTFREVSISLIDIIRVVDGMAVEHWGEADMLGLLQQLGALPVGE